MATSLGALLIYDWQLALAFTLVFGVAFAALRKTVLPGLFAMACLPLVSAYLGRGQVAVVGLAAQAALVLFAHRQNLMTQFLALLDRRPVHPKHDSPEA